jgi:hypothetical protein
MFVRSGSFSTKLGYRSHVRFPPIATKLRTCHFGRFVPRTDMAPTERLLGRTPTSALSMPRSECTSASPKFGIEASFPGFVEPALATSIGKTRSGDHWIHEISCPGPSRQHRGHADSTTHPQRRWDGDQTAITMASNFEGDAKEFAVVVPVPTLRYWRSAICFQHH